MTENREGWRRRVTVTLDPEVLKQAKECAATEGISFSRFIENAVRTYLDLIKASKKVEPKHWIKNEYV